MHALNHYMIRI